MPTYDYRCTTCGHTFEYWQSMKDEPLVTCPPDQCTHTTKGSGTVQRIITGGTGIIYKGEGFYHTDYVKKKETKRETEKETNREIEKEKSSKTTEATESSSSESTSSESTSSESTSSETKKTIESKTHSSNSDSTPHKT